ncbi:MAG TPA: hypothetical protein VNG71_15735 [Pyrinomonadaceae bacterium]|nr:hypothetical protein [Pyrinomonadaceae bacterium]
MKVSLLITLLLASLASAQNLQILTGEGSVVVLGSKWLPVHRTFKKDVPNMAPPPELTAGNKNAGRIARINNPQIPDPNETTIDGRSAAIEKIVQEARTADPKPLDGFSYVAKIRNGGKQAVEIVFWEYQFIDAASKNVTRHQFLCGVKIKPDKEKEVEAFSMMRPSGVVDAGTLVNHNALQEKVLINRVEYADGTIWQRRDWSFAAIREGYKRAIETPWGNEMCRSL